VGTILGQERHKGHNSWTKCLNTKLDPEEEGKAVKDSRPWRAGDKTDVGGRLNYCVNVQFTEVQNPTVVI
jgi:hypothetical protein